ncbi:MAG: hypothetical protein AAF658_07675 [Myxococcota bacterium]
MCPRRGWGRLLAVAAVVLLAFSVELPEADAGVLRKVRARTQKRGRVKAPARRSGGSTSRRTPPVRGRGGGRLTNRYLAGYGAGLFLYGPYGYYRPQSRYMGGFGVRRGAPPPVEPAPREPFHVQFGLARGRGSGDDGFVDRYRLDLRVQTPWSFDLSTGGLMMVEPLRDGTYDQLALWKATAWLRLVEREALEASVGLGFRRLFDPADGENGGHLAGSVRLFPIEPFVFEGRIDAGRIGEATHLDWRLSGGIVFGPAEIQLAWTGLTFDDVELIGPAIGLRFWL